MDIFFTLQYSHEALRAGLCIFLEVEQACCQILVTLTPNNRITTSQKFWIYGQKTDSIAEK